MQSAARASIVAVVVVVASCDRSTPSSRAPADATGSAAVELSTWTAMSLASSRSFEVAEVQMADEQVCARSRSGDVACWGDDLRPSESGTAGALPTSTPHRLDQIDDARDVVLVGGLYVLRSAGTVVFVRDGRITPVDGFTDVVQIESSGRSICARRRDGRVRCHGELEWASGRDASVPLDLPLPPAAGLACGRRGCCSWSAGGDAHCVGDDATLGLSAQPRRLPFAGVTGIAVGDETACATTRSGAQCWGKSLTHRFDDWTPPRDGVVIPAYDPCVLTGAELRCVGRQQPVTIADVASMATDGDTSCAVLRSGALTCWGVNTNGAFADGVAIARPIPTLVEGVAATRITAAHDDTCAVTPTGELVCWGRGRDQGKPVRAGAAAAVAVSAQHSATCGLDDGIRCRFTELDGEDTEVRIPFAGKIRGAAIDRPGNVCVVDVRGDVRCHFSLSEGGIDGTWAALAVAEPVTAIAPRGIGFVFSSASGRVYEWIDRRFDEDPDYVDAPEGTPSATPVAIDPVTEITAHQNGGCAVTRGGDVVCWGGIGFAHDYAPATPTVIEGLHGAHGLSAKHFHVCGIVGDEARCFGDDAWGQLGRASVGQGATRAEAVALPAAVVQVAAGAEHTCAVLVDRRVYCWGSDRAGQLGQGRVIQSALPVASVLGPSRSP